MISFEKIGKLEDQDKRGTVKLPNGECLNTGRKGGYWWSSPESELKSDVQIVQSSSEPRMRLPHPGSTPWAAQWNSANLHHVQPVPSKPQASTRNTPAGGPSSKKVQQGESFNVTSKQQAKQIICTAHSYQPQTDIIHNGTKTAACHRSESWSSPPRTERLFLERIQYLDQSGEC